MAAQTKKRVKPHPRLKEPARATAPQVPGPTESSYSLDALMHLADELVKEKQGGMPARTREYLDLAKPALQKLVDAKITMKDIYARFINRQSLKINNVHFRTYMRETFNYPDPALSRVGKRKKSAKKGVKKAAKKTAGASRKS